MPSPWPFFTTRGPLTEAEILLDTTCFSTSDFDNLDDPVSEDYSPPLACDLTDMPRAITGEVGYAEASRRKALSSSTLDLQARYHHPTFPVLTFLTTLFQPARFALYISKEFPSSDKNQLYYSTTTNHEPLHKEVNTTIANTLLSTNFPTTQGNREWIEKAVFPDKVLPVPFNELEADSDGQLQECWDEAQEKFLHFPANNMVEHAVQDWLNHLRHTLGVVHGLIQEGPNSKDSEEPNLKEFAGTYTAEDVDERRPVADSNDAGINNGAERKGFVIKGAADRSFSMVSHNKGPTGGYRLCKPDIILMNRNTRHFLKDGQLRPRWHHVEAIVEVSSSAPRTSILQQILEKAALMFEAQPFRRFVIGLALRGTGDNVEFCFVLVDRAGVCVTEWYKISGYEGISLARIVFALSYTSPEVLGVDTSMTIDPFSGDITKIKCQGREFRVVKHIHSSLVLVGRGTHVFLVQDEDKNFHILKDAWILTSHGISEINTLSLISDALRKDSSSLSLMHPRFIVGEEMDDSTNTRRGKLVMKPPERVHRRVVTGPVGDPLTSFRSRIEFVKVLLDCVNCKSSI